MRFKAIFNLPTLDITKWKAKIEREMTDALELGVIAWLSAATAPIPVWSGASLATFKPLAQRVNFVLSINPTTIGSQLGLGPNVGAARSTGKLFGDPRKGEFFAEYTTNLAHLIFNEFANANSGADPKVFARLKNPGPYNFQIAGNNAFRQAVGSIRLPFPKLISKQRVKV